MKFHCKHFPFTLYRWVELIEKQHKNEFKWYLFSCWLRISLSGHIVNHCWSSKLRKVFASLWLFCECPLLAGDTVPPPRGWPKRRHAMQAVNWEGIRLPRSFHSFIARGARAGEEIHNLGSWLGWVVLVTVEKTCELSCKEKWVT